MCKKWMQRIMIVFLLSIAVFMVFGGQTQGLLFKNTTPSKVLAANANDDKEKNGDEKGKSKQSYASLVFDDTDKNASIMYYKNQTGSGVPTVESVIDKSAGDGEGQKYAAFLQSLNKWNLYKAYTDQKDAGLAIVVAGLKAIFALPLLLCLYLMDGIDGLIKVIGKLVNYLNIFQYLTDSSGNIPTDNPLHVLQPIADLYKQFNIIAKMIIAAMLGWVLFKTATGIGRARNRSGYLGHGLGKVIASLLAVAFGALIVSSFLGIFSDMMTKDRNVAKDTLNDVPAKHIVDTSAYIDASLSNMKTNEADAKGLNGGYVLLHKDLPKTQKEVKNKIPTAETVKYLNTGGNSKNKTPDGKALLMKWIGTTTVTSADIDSMYKISKKDKKGDLFGIFGKDEKRSFQFKLAPGKDTVKTFDKKRMISTDLNAVAIQTASMAGNGGAGIFLNGIKMAATIYGTTIVVVVLLFSMIRALVKSTGLFLANVSIASLGSPDALLAILSTGIMLFVSWISALAIMPLYASLTSGIEDNVASAINNNVNMSGLSKQTIVTFGVVFVQWFAAILALKSRGAVLSSIEDFFKGVIQRMSGFTENGSKNRGMQALSDMNNADKAGYEGALNKMSEPINRGKEALENAPAVALGKAGDMASGIKDKAKEKAAEGYENAKETASNIKGKFGSKEEVDDADKQGEAINDEVRKGMEQMGKTSNDSIDKNLNNQDEAVDKAIKDQEALNTADQELKDAQDHYDELKANGASPAELAQAQEAVTSAQDKYDRASANAQQSARDMAGTGVSADSISDAKNQSARDFAKASSDVATAERDLKDLQEERNAMVRAGATGDELAGIDNQISNAQDRVESAKDRQELAKQAHQASIGNAQAEKDFRNDLVAARQGEREAVRMLESAKQTGNLSSEQQANLRSKADAISPEFNNLQSQAKSELHDAQTAQGALEFMSQNHNQAFTADDVGNFQKFADSSSEQVQVAKSNLEQAKANKQPKSEISRLNEQLMEANRANASAQTVMNAIGSGSANAEAITAQEQIVQTAMEQQKQAQASLQNVQAQAAGGNVSRSAYNQANNDARIATQNADIARKTLSGLYAMKAAGSNSLTENAMDSAKSDVANQIKQAEAKVSTLGNASKAVENVMMGGPITKESTAQLVEAQQIAQTEAAAKTAQAKSTYDDLSKRLVSLKSQLANGKPVSGEVKRMQTNVEQAEKVLTNAENKERSIRQTGSTFRKTGRTILSNIEKAETEVENKKVTSQRRDKAYNNVLKTGGYTTEQLSQFKDNISNDRQNFKQNGRIFKRERGQRLNNINDKFRKAEDIMKSGQDQ
ncbi:hypothetical protein [Staphylococcus gallinarum]|uniref:hypothetical protein n=1 Tax=Staphylococcus gallinarum TaxID=1293 RepID=UPI001E53CCF4|nr:hypothetical protein [Staphylococcus gallinarum]MCD8845179.1 hypothetical protein [Staphylococcus gallinarum]